MWDYNGAHTDREQPGTRGNLTPLNSKHPREQVGSHLSVNLTQLDTRNTFFQLLWRNTVNILIPNIHGVRLKVYMPTDMGREQAGTSGNLTPLNSEHPQEQVDSHLSVNFHLI